MEKDYTTFSGQNPFSTQAKLILHYDKLNKYLKDGDVDCPIFMEVGLTNKCNMECYWCITENGRDNINGEYLDIEVLKKFLIDYSQMGGKAITFAGQGEPTFYKYFVDAVNIAKECNLKIGLMTNGVYRKSLNEVIGNNFEWIRISLDTIDSESYKKWKNVDGVSVIMKNIEILKQYKVKVGINCNVGDNITVDHAKEMINWATENNGVDYLQFRPILPRYYKKEETDYKINKKSEINSKVWDYIDTKTKNNSKINLSDDKRLELLNGTAYNFRSCEGHFFEPILAATGEIKVCTYHPNDPKLTFGNIYNSSFKEIWGSQQRKSAIDYVRKLNYPKKCQMCCKLSEPNKLIDFLKHPEEMVDLDFL